MQFGARRKAKHKSEPVTLAPTSVRLDSDLLMKRVEREHAERLHTRRQIDDLIELLEEALIEHGNKHTDACDKQTTPGAPCSCGFASLLKARTLASRIEA